MIKAISFFLLLFVFQISNAAHYYISPSGLDTNSGTTESQAWRTFEHAFTVMIGGDTLVLLDGTYTQELHPPASLSGTESSYTTFKAKNPGSVILAPTSVGNGQQEGVIYVYSNTTSQTSYIHFDGLFAEGVGENPAIGIASADYISESEMTHHIKLTRCGAMGSALDYNVVVVSLGGVRDILVEDCFAFGFGRKAMQAYGCRRITIRRVVVRYDWWEGDSYKPSDPRVNLSTYNTIEATLENIIAIDAGPHPAATSPDRAGLVTSGNQADGTTIEGSEDVAYLGCLVFNDREHSSKVNGIEVNGGSGTPAKKLLFKDIVIHGANAGLNVQNNVDSVEIINVTSTHNGYTGIRVNPYPTHPISNVLIDKSVSTDNDNRGISWDPNVVTITNTTTARNVNGSDMETEYEPSIDYLPTNIPVEDHERGGIVEFKYVDRVLTDDALWPFPYEDVIKQYMCNSTYLQEIEDTINNYEGSNITYNPGLCASNKTLTDYTWSYLGEDIPNYIYKTTYYVSTSGDDSNSGLSEAEAWRTITYAASAGSPVESGDTVYVKAGNYGNENVAFEKDGVKGHPIVFEGYQNTPGDNPDLNHSFGDALDASVMPLLDGGNRASGGVAFTFYSRKYITLKNIQTTKYEVGIDGWDASNITLDNITATSFGDVSAGYSGTGISFSPDGSGDNGNYNKLNNCFIENAAAEGFSIVGNHNELHNCSVYCNEDTDNAAMDYYIVFEGNNNLVNNCYAERIGILDHDGHGIGFKGNCQYNSVKNSTAKNLGGGFYVRHRGCKYNTFENCKVYDLFGLLVRDGASNNIFRSCETINSESAVIFYDTDEDDGAQYTGRNNVFENCIFRNTTDNVIDFFYYDRESICDSNTFVNCVIDQGDYLFNCDRSNNANKLVNCIVTNVQNYSRTASHQAVSYPLNVILDHSDFYNNGFAAPTGTSITTFDPQFVDISNNDYHLQATSQCIDAGTNNDAPNIDFDSVPRPLLGNIDLGVYEYGIWWNGNISHDWHTAGNWSNNLIPSNTSSVTIPNHESYGFYPEINSNAQLKKIYLYDDGQMIIKENINFDVLE